MLDQVLEFVVSLEALSLDGIRQVLSNADYWIRHTQALQITILVVGLLFCFFGVSWNRFFAGVEGLVIGILGALSVGLWVGLLPNVILIVCLVAGILFVALCSIFYRLGAFVSSFTAGIVVVLFIFGTRMKFNLLSLLIAVGVGLVFGIIAAILKQPAMILFLSAMGGTMAGSMILLLLLLNETIGIVVCAGLAILGVILQLVHRSRVVGKKEKGYAHQVKAENSMELEVEAAKTFLNDEEDDDEDDEDEE